MMVAGKRPFDLPRRPKVVTFKMKKLIWPAAAACLLLGVYAAWRAERGGPGLIVIDIERSNFETLKAVAGEGRAPALKKLIEAGTAYPLAPAGEGNLSFWAEVLTGTSVEKLGLPDSVTRNGITSSADLKSPPLFITVARAGQKTAVMAAPFAWPALPEIACAFEAMPDDDPKNPKAAKPPDLGTKIFAGWQSAAAIPREVYQALLPMNDADWEDFLKSEAEGANDKWSAARLAVAVDYNYRGAAGEIVDACRPEALFLHFPGGMILENGLDYMEPGFSAQLSGLVNLALYEELKKSYLVFMDGLIAEIVKKAGPRTAVVVIASPGRPSVSSPEAGEPPAPQGFIILSGPGVEKKGLAGKAEDPARVAAIVLGLIGAAEK
jgi:hypothetical protein